MIVNKEFIEEIRLRSEALCKKYSEIDISKYKEKICSALYGKDSRMFSRSILRHIDENKCLFKRLSSKLKENQNANDYAKFYFDEHESLIMSEVLLPYEQSVVTVYIDEKIQATYLYANKKCSLYSLECCEYDTDGKLLSCETYSVLFKPPYGIRVDSEYYTYRDNLLLNAVKLENFNANFKLNEMMKALSPKRIINPDIYEYVFIYENEVLCKKTYKFAEDNYLEETINLKKSELDKLKKHDIDCFGIE